MTTSHSTVTDAHDHDASGHAKPSYDDVNIPVLFMVVIISALITALIVAFVQGLAYRWENYYIREQVYGRGNRAVTEIIEGQKNNLANVEGKPGQVAIEEAKNRVIRAFGGESAAGNAVQGGKE